MSLEGAFEGRDGMFEAGACCTVIAINDITGSNIEQHVHQCWVDK